MLYKQPANWILLDIVIYMYTLVSLYVWENLILSMFYRIKICTKMFSASVFLNRLQTELNSRRERIRGIFLDYLEND